MGFTTTALAKLLRGWPVPGRYVAMVSGGCDSMVLMHALAELREHLDAPVVVLHFDHGLIEASPKWAMFVESRAKALGLPFFLERLELNSGPAVETRAREARYARLRSWMQIDDCCLSAHHADDQLETFFMHALRGSGTAGLAGIRVLTRFGSGWLGRPLLEWTRAELNEWAGRHALEWVEDPANQDLSLPRNWLRMQVAPFLRQRWPQAAHTITRSARLAGEADGLLSEIANEDLERIGLGHPACLSVSRLLACSPPRRRNILRHWLQRLELPAPTSRKLHEIDARFVCRNPGGQAVLGWPGGCVRRYRDCLFAHSPWGEKPSDAVLTLRPGAPLDLGYLGTLALVRDSGGPLCEGVTAGSLTVRFRQGGERLQPAGGTHHRTLKNILQEQGIVPWMRERLPVLYSGDRLAAVAGVVGAVEGFSGHVWRLSWSGAPPIRIPCNRAVAQESSSKR